MLNIVSDQELAFIKQITWIGSRDTEQDWLKSCEEVCFECGKPADFISSPGVALCASCAKLETENEVY